jgi:hypothetical protein
MTTTDTPLHAWIAAHGKPTTVAQAADALVAAVATLSTTGNLAPSHLPTDDEVREATVALFTDRGKAGLRLRASMPQAAGDWPRAVRGMLDWHTGGGHLMGYMMASLRTDRADAADTLAAVILVLTGRRSSALAAWHRALGGD